MKYQVMEMNRKIDEEYECAIKEVDEMLEKINVGKQDKECNYEPQKLEETLKEIDETLDKIDERDKNCEAKKRYSHTYD